MRDKMIQFADLLAWMGLETIIEPLGIEIELSPNAFDGMIGRDKELICRYIDGLVKEISRSAEVSEGTLIPGNHYTIHDFLWQLIRLTAEQRCHVAMEVIKGSKTIIAQLVETEKELEGYAR